MKKEVIIITIVTSISSIINNLGHPVTPELTSSLGMSTLEYGLMFAMMSLALFATSPLWGKLSDRYGRKPFIIIAPIGYGIFQFLFAYLDNTTLILFVRMGAGGIASASFVCGLAYLVDVTDKDERASAMTFYTASLAFFVSIGYLLGGWIGNNDYHIAFYAQAVLSISSSLLFYFLLPESTERKMKEKNTNMIDTITSMKGTGFTLLLIVVFVGSFGFTAFNTGFNMMMKYTLNFQSIKIGFVMATTGIIGLFTNTIIFKYLHKRYHDISILAVNLIVIGTSLTISTFFMNTLFYAIFPLIIYFGSLAMYKPIVQASISNFAKDNNGEIMGMTFAANAFGMIFGSLFSGWALDINVQMTFYAIAIIFIIAFIFVRLFKKKHFYNSF